MLCPNCGKKHKKGRKLEQCMASVSNFLCLYVVGEYRHETHSPEYIKAKEANDKMIEYYNEVCSKC